MYHQIFFSIDLHGARSLSAIYDQKMHHFDASDTFDR